MSSWIYIKFRTFQKKFTIEVFREKRQFLTIILFGCEAFWTFAEKYINAKNTEKMLQALFLMEEHLAFAALLQVFHSKQNMVQNSQ